MDRRRRRGDGDAGRARAGAGNKVHAARAYLRLFSGLSANARRLLLGNLCINVGVGTGGVLFNLYLVALGFPLSFIGLVAAITTVGQAAVAPLMAWALRRFGMREVMIAGTVAMAAASALTALLARSAPLAIASLLSGAAFSVATIPASPYMMEHSTAKDRSHLFAAYFASNTTGSMIGSLLSGAVPALVIAIAGAHGQTMVLADRLGLLVGAAVTGLGAWLLWGLRAEAPSIDSADRPAHSLREEPEEGERTRRDVLVMLAATGLIALSMGAILPFFNVYFSARLHAGTATIGVIYALSGLICTVAAFLAPVAGRRGNLHGFSAARMLTAPLFLFFWLHPGLGLAAVAYIGRNSMGTVSGALENTFAMEIMPARLRGVVASWRSFAFNAAWSLGSLVAGVVVVALGYDVIFIAGAALTLVGSALYFARFTVRSRR